MKLEFIKQHQLEFLREGQYIKDNETPQERFQEIVDKVREYESSYSEGLADRIAYMIDRNIFSLSTPAIANFGRKKREGSNTQPLPASCNIVTVGNSISDIYYSIAQTAMLSKLGAGVGTDFQLVCQKGTKLSEGFYSNSKLDWIEDTVRAAQKVSQQAVRRGYNTPFISILDNDFDELMDRIDKSNPDKNDPLINNTVGIILPRGFREELKTNNEHKRRYLKVLKARQKTGKVYMMDVENANKNSSPVYKALGKDVQTTNICCVTGETLILTDKGQIPISELVGKEVNVWNGEQFSKVTPFLAGENQEVYKVELSGGQELNVTDNHNFYVQEGEEIVKKPTKDLSEGESLIEYSLPIFEDGKLLPAVVDEPINIKVVSITKVDGKHDVFCFTEPLRGMGVFNGVLTGQSEFLQPLFDDMTSVCVIGALNLVYWDEITTQMIKDAFMFLDIMNEEYVKLTEGVPFMEKARKAAMNKRDIGLGALGFHELLQMKGYAFGDIQSRRLNKEIFKTIREAGEAATKEMAEKLGSAPICEEAGFVRRNASLIMVAPNKSTSFISGVTSGGIEPFMTNISLMTLAKKQYVFKNPHLESLLESKGQNTPEIWDSILSNQGSVQHLDFLSKEERDVFRTFSEISPKDIIDLAADRQEYIDMGQSLNLVFRKNYTLQDVYDIHKYAWDSGIKTLYYAYPSAHAALEKEGESWDTCVSCAD